MKNSVIKELLWRDICEGKNNLVLCSYEDIFRKKVEAHHYTINKDELGDYEEQSFRTRG